MMVIGFSSISFFLLSLNSKLKQKVHGYWRIIWNILLSVQLLAVSDSCSTGNIRKRKARRKNIGKERSNSCESYVTGNFTTHNSQEMDACGFYRKREQSAYKITHNPCTSVPWTQVYKWSACKDFQMYYI